MDPVATRESAEMGSPPDDARPLIERLAGGDRQALAELYARYQGPLFRYLLQLTGDRELAEEVLQDTLVAVWKYAATFEGRSTVQTWLIGIARRQAHNTLRRRTLPRADAAALADLAASEPDPEDLALASAEREELVAALTRLAPMHREVLGLIFEHGLSYQETARILGVPEGTVKSRLSNAKRALRARLVSPEEVDR
jgi:RNA polymerase sigma factor (sigma-70 family)